MKGYVKIFSIITDVKDTAEYNNVRTVYIHDKEITIFSEQNKVTEIILDTYESLFIENCTVYYI